MKDDSPIKRGLWTVAGVALALLLTSIIYEPARSVDGLWLAPLAAGFLVWATEHIKRKLGVKYAA